MTPCMFPLRGFGWVNMVFVYYAKVYAKQLRMHLTLYLTTLELCLSNWSITVMKSEAALVMLWLHLPFPRPWFWWVSLPWNSLLTWTINMELWLSLWWSWHPSKPGIDCRTLTGKDTILDFMSDPWLPLSLPHQMALPWRLISSTFFASGTTSCSHAILPCFHGSVEFNEFF